MIALLCIAVAICIKTNQNPKEGGGAPRRHPLLGFRLATAIDAHLLILRTRSQ
jgi:hypothetical protein